MMDVTNQMACKRLSPVWGGGDWHKSPPGRLGMEGGGLVFGKDLKDMIPRAVAACVGLS